MNQDHTPKKSPIYPGFREMTDAHPEPLYKQELSLPRPKSVGEVWNLYREVLLTEGKQKEITHTQTALFEFTFPALEGSPLQKSTKITPDEIQAAVKFLEGIELARLKDFLDFQEKVFNQLKLSRQKRHTPRSYLRQMVAWVYSQGWLELEDSDKEIIYVFKSQKKSRRYSGDIVHTKRQIPDAYMLGVFDEDYLICYKNDVEVNFLEQYGRWIFLTSSFKELNFYFIFIGMIQKEPFYYLGNESLDQEVISYLQFLDHTMGFRPPTIEKNVGDLLRLLGWLYRQKNIPLQQLYFSTLIPFIPLKVEISLNMSQDSSFDPMSFYAKKMMNQERAKEAARVAIQQLREFLEFSRPCNATAVVRLTAAINCAKFIYRNETEEFRTKGGFSDVPQIKSLCNLRSDYERKTRRASGASDTVIPRHQKMIPWTLALEVLEKLRIEATQTHRFHVRYTRRRLSGRYPVEKIKRTDNAIAQDFQIFLIVALITAMPPARPRIYRELEYGRTLLKGNFDGGVFTPIEKMSNSVNAKYYLHLMPEDYKTGDTYGECWQKIPNIKYIGGKFLYEYIEEWLNRWRSIFKPTHNYFFTTHQGNPISTSGFKEKIKNNMCRFTEVPVTPNAFRHMFITYLKEIGASEAELEAAALAQRHSRKTQSKIYDLQNNQNKISPIISLTQKIIEGFFADFEKSIDDSGAVEQE